MDTSKNDVINTLYQSTLLATPTIAYSYLLKRFLKLNIGPPSSAGLEEILKLGGVVAVSNMTLDYLYKQGIIPQNIIKKVSRRPLEFHQVTKVLLFADRKYY